MELGIVLMGLLAIWAAICAVATQRRPGAQRVASQRDSTVKTVVDDPSIGPEKTQEKVEEADQRMIRKAGMDEIEWLLRLFVIGYFPKVRDKVRKMISKQP